MHRRGKKRRRHFGCVCVCVGDICASWARGGGGMMERPLKKKKRRRREYWASSEDLSLSPPLDATNQTGSSRERKREISISFAKTVAHTPCLALAFSTGQSIIYVYIYTVNISYKKRGTVVLAREEREKRGSDETWKKINLSLLLLDTFLRRYNPSLAAYCRWNTPTFHDYKSHLIEWASTTG